MPKPLILQYPMMGKNTNFAATTQPGFTSPRMNNARPRDVLEYRARGGQRPGWAKAYNQLLGENGDNPVTLSETEAATTIATTTMTGVSSDWNTVGATLVKAGDIVRITAGTGVAAGDYRVASITSDTVIVLATSPGTYNPTDADLAYTIERAVPVSAICQVTIVEL